MKQFILIIWLKMALYIDVLPSDLLKPLFLYLSRHDLSLLLPIIKDMGNCSRLLSNKLFWTSVWKRDISSIIIAPNNIETQCQEILNMYKTLTFDQANLDLLTVNGYDILLYDIFSLNMHQNPEILMILRNHVLATATYSNHISIMRKMFEFGADDYTTALVEVSGTNNIDALDVLISKMKGTVDFDALLNVAAADGKLIMSRYLIQLGARLFNWAMYNAAMYGHIEIVELLLEKGATNHEECINIAQSRNRVDIADFIKQYIDRSSDISLKNKSGPF